MSLLVDTNLLTRISEPDSGFHALHDNRGFDSGAGGSAEQASNAAALNFPGQICGMRGLTST
jgi:hypothetical protein